MRKVDGRPGRLAVALALLISAGAGCKDMQRVEALKGGPPASNKSGNIMQPTEKTIERLRGSDRWAVAVLRCEQASVTGAGTRSQMLVFRAAVLKTTDDKVPSPLNLEQYSAADTLLDAGRVYLVILAGLGRGEDPVAWNVVQREVIEEASASGEMLRVNAAITEKLK